MRRSVTLAGILLLVGTLVSACGQGMVEQPPDEVTVQLKWFHQAQFAGFYGADQNGSYAEENIAVTFVAGGPAIDLLAAVLDGTAQFGVADATELIVARADGKPVQAIATIYRRNPRVYVAKADSGIRRPEDFAGESVFEIPSGTPTLHAMMANVGATPNQYTVVSEPYDLDLFGSDQITVWGVYLTGSIRLFEEAGYDLHIIYPSDYGIHFYADTLFATEQFIEENPDLVERFVRATLHGWRWAIENPEEAGQLPLLYDPALESDVQVDQMIASVPLIHTGHDQIGWMQQDVWRGMHDVLLEQGVLEEPVDLDMVYTMKFLERIHEEAS